MDLFAKYGETLEKAESRFIKKKKKKKEVEVEVLKPSCKHVICGKISKKANEV